MNSERVSKQNKGKLDNPRPEGDIKNIKSNFILKKYLLI